MKKIIICLTMFLCYVSSYAINLGDKVVLDKNATHYETGQRIKKSCLGKEYTVLQVGTNEFPTGILLKEIYSWVKYSDVGISKEEFEESKQRFANEQMQLVYKETVVKTDTIYQIIKDTELKFVTDTLIKVVTDTVVVYDTIFANRIEEKIIVKTDTINDNIKPFNRLSLGLRGGVASYMPSAENLAWNIGYQGVFDVQFAHYFKRKNEHKPYCGILVGVSAGYASSSVSGIVNDAYSTTDAEGSPIDYTITVADATYTMSEVQLQVPVMFSLLYKGLYFNVGPRFVVPVYTMGHQMLNDAHITANYSSYGVTLTDAVITGKLADEQLDAPTAWDSPKIQINASLEIGYEFALKNGDAFGLGLYADYGVYNTYKANQSAQSMINISQVGADVQNPAPKVDVLPMLSSYSTNLGNFDAGIKLVYHFNFK